MGFDHVVAPVGIQVGAMDQNRRPGGVGEVDLGLGEFISRELQA
jgi:hypothetical protein